MTYPYQRCIIIDKPSAANGMFFALPFDALQQACRDLNGAPLVLYLYLHQHKDGFEVMYSPQAFMNWSSFSKTTAHNAMKVLVEKGYVTKINNLFWILHSLPTNGKEQPNEDSGAAQMGTQTEDTNLSPLLDEV